ncbi:hypothetical protein [Neptunicella marina]|uniref:Solute-binding protein family 3/N-terminal domain-containing protein n=1 Tax=Neptunicella marina TaxID=2125989 RepID=A0A8J6M227_9ALTE|nr:hypothetical protein [Neptunicella marina]MBC3767814.1 hypothetical protein [Neptunicella marina]
MLIRLLGTLLLFAVYVTSSAYAQDAALHSKTDVIVIPKPVEGTEPLHSYLQKILDAALVATQKQYGVMTVHKSPFISTQARQFRQLNDGSVDLIWSITTDDRELHYQAIPFPLFGMLFSYRVLAINQNDSRFSSSLSLNELKQLKTVQGYDWPDLKMLEENGFNVKPSEYTLAFRLLENKFIDYFPRSVIEVCDELSLHPLLHVSEHQLLHYPNVMYFFMKKGKEQLASRIETGLMIIYRQGTLLKILQEQPFFKQALALTHDRHIFELKSPVSQGLYILEHPFNLDVQRLIQQQKSSSKNACLY